MQGASIGKAHVFDTFPSVVLAKDQAGNDAIAIRELELGRVVGFHHGGNWNGMTLLDSGEARRLFVDGVHWAWGQRLDLHRLGGGVDPQGPRAAARRISRGAR